MVWIHEDSTNKIRDRSVEHMRSNEEFTIDEVKEISDKIDYIRIGEKIIKGYKYSDVIHGLIKRAITSGNYGSLEASRIIYFDKKEFANTYECKGWYYTVPKRKSDQINKIIRIMKVTSIPIDFIHIKFISSAEEIQLHKQQIEAEKLQKRIEADRSKYYAAIINDEVIISDEELKQMIFDDCAFGMRYGEMFDSRQYERRISNLSFEREQLRKQNIARKKRHIDWLLNDEKQAELFNCSVEEYVTKFKKDNLMEIVV